MEERSPRTVSRLWLARSIPLGLALGVVIAAPGCSGLHAGPRTLAAVGAALVAAGGGTWSAGEVNDPSGASATSHALITAGFASVVTGLAVIVAAGGWMAATVACHADPDCPDEEQCREIPAPPGGIPYKQCVPR
jgi:hypothetical protein